MLPACGSKDQLPSGILEQDKMQQVLWDMMRADQYLGNYKLTQDSSQDKTKISLRYYQQVFAIHKISKETFQKSFDYYRTHPLLFKMIMDSIAKPVDATPTQMLTPLAADSSNKLQQ